MHIEWQNRYIDGLVRPQLRGIARDSAARYGVEDIYSIKRDDLATEIEDALRITLNDNGLILDDFVLRNITFTAEYAAVIEQKQIAEQQLLKAQTEVKIAEQEAKRYETLT